MMDDDFACWIHAHGDELVIAIRGDLDLATSGRLKTEATPHVKTGTRVVLDCSQVTFCDCAGLLALAELRARAHTADTGFALAGASDAVLRVLELSGTTDLFRTLPAPDPAEPGLPSAGRARATA